jgi:hypothetical protein
MSGIPAEWLATLAWRDRIAEMAQALLTRNSDGADRG